MEEISRKKVSSEINVFGNMAEIDGSQVTTIPLSVEHQV
jgi:hypothetical protein